MQQPKSTSKQVWKARWIVYVIAVLIPGLIWTVAGKSDSTLGFITFLIQGTIASVLWTRKSSTRGITTYLDNALAVGILQVLTNLTLYWFSTGFDLGQVWILALVSFFGYAIGYIAYWVARLIGLF